MGAGDLLMSFLGVVILSFGFSIYGQLRLMKRHAPEIFGDTTLSAAVYLFSTAFAAKAMGLAPGDCLVLSVIWSRAAHGSQSCPKFPQALPFKTEQTGRQVYSAISVWNSSLSWT